MYVSVNWIQNRSGWWAHFPCGPYESGNLSYTVIMNMNDGGLTMEYPFYNRNYRRNKSSGAGRTPQPGTEENHSEDNLIVENNTVYEIDLECLKRRQKPR